MVEELFIYEVYQALLGCRLCCLRAVFSVPRFETCYQIAFAIKDEVEDLEKAGINVIQIDEAALREGLPLRKAEHAFYLDWAVHSFRITNCGVQDTTQVLSSALFLQIERFKNKICSLRP